MRLVQVLQALVVNQGHSQLLLKRQYLLVHLIELLVVFGALMPPVLRFFFENLYFGNVVRDLALQKPNHLVAQTQVQFTLDNFGTGDRQIVVRQTRSLIAPN